MKSFKVPLQDAFVTKVLVTDVTLEILWHVMLAGHVTSQVACPLQPLAANLANESHVRIVNRDFVPVQGQNSVKGLAAPSTLPQDASETLSMLHIL